MAQHVHEYAEIAGCRTEFLRGGAGEPLLFLHGAGGAGAWLPFMDRLAENFDLIVPSHPGFGDSDTPDWLDRISDMAYFYLDFIEAFDLKGVHLMGASIGGWIAAEIAVRNTSRLKTLTLVSAAGIHLDGVDKGDIFIWSPEKVVRSLFHDQGLAEKRLAQEFTPEELDTQVKNQFTTAKLAWNPRFLNPDLAKWLHRIDVPTMVLWGENDKIFPAPYAHEFARLVPGARVKIIPDCGHLPQIEQTGAFLEGVLEITNGTRP